MPLGIEVGLGTSDFVLDGDPAPLPKKGRSPQIFGPCLLWPNGWMDQDGTWHGTRPQSRRLGVEVGLSLGDFVLDGDPAPFHKRGRASSPIFGPLLLLPNGWMHQYGTWHGGGPWSRPHCSR